MKEHEIISQLHQYGQYLIELGDALQATPHKTYFTNQPGNIDQSFNYSPPASLPPFDWNNYPDKKDIATLCQQLRNLRS